MRIEMAKSSSGYVQNQTACNAADGFALGVLWGQLKESGIDAWLLPNGENAMTVAVRLTAKEAKNS